MHDIIAGLGKVDVMARDFNARHTDWPAGSGDDVCYPLGVSWQRIIDKDGLVWLHVGGPTYRDVSVLDLTFCKAGSVLSPRYVDLAGLDHQGQVLQLQCSLLRALLGRGFNGGGWMEMCWLEGWRIGWLCIVGWKGIMCWEWLIVLRG